MTILGIESSCDETGAAIIEVKENYGYKVFLVEKVKEGKNNKQKIMGLFYCFKNRPVGRWLNSENYGSGYKEIGTSGLYDIYGYYSSGWHIFLNKKDAYKYQRSLDSALSFKKGLTSKVRKVKFKSVVAKGVQDFFPCVVAKEMIIIPKNRG